MIDFGFKEYLQLQEMAARKSLARSLEKWMDNIDKPVAVLTAFRSEHDLETNRKRNEELVKDLTAAGLSHYPVTGQGQEIKRWAFLFRVIEPTKEESFVVQPRGEMSDTVFVSTIQGLMNTYNQDFVAMKLPSSPDAFLLGRNGNREPLGRSAHPRREENPFYSELLKGVRTPPEQMSGWERTGERSLVRRFINWLRGRSHMNHPVPADERGGRRFVVGDAPKHPQGNA